MKGEKQFQNTYIMLLNINILLYLFTLLGIINTSTKYLYIFNIFLRTAVSLFLLIRFNPYRKIKFTENDRKIVFSASFFLFSTTTLNDIIKNYFEKKISTTNINFNNKLSFNFKNYHVF